MTIKQQLLVINIFLLIELTIYPRESWMIWMKEAFSLLIVFYTFNSGEVVLKKKKNVNNMGIFKRANITWIGVGGKLAPMQGTTINSFLRKPSFDKIILNLSQTEHFRAWFYSKDTEKWHGLLILWFPNDLHIHSSLRKPNVLGLLCLKAFKFMSHFQEDCYIFVIQWLHRKRKCKLGGKIHRFPVSWAFPTLR